MVRAAENDCKNEWASELSLSEEASLELVEFAQAGRVTLFNSLVAGLVARGAVNPTSTLPQHALRPPIRLGADEGCYTTADGAKVFNERVKKFDVFMLDGRHPRSMIFQIAKHNKALRSVSQIGRDTYVQNKRVQEYTWNRKESVVCVLDLLVGPIRRRGP